MVETHSILLDIFNIVLPSIAILTSMGILFLISYHRRQYPINTSVLLIGNTYLFLMFTSLCLVDICAHNLYGDLYGNVSFANWWCYVRVYLLHVELCSIYLSYLLQALFRLFRIVLYRYQRLQTFRFILRLIIFQWFLAFLLIIPAIPLGYFQYIPQVYYCHVPLTNLRGTIFVSLTSCYGPTVISSVIYIYIIYYIKHREPLAVQQNRHRSIQRDLIVLRRINVLVTIFLLFLVPPMVLWFHYIATGYLYPLIYHIEWLTVSTSLSTLSIVSAMLNPQIRQLLLLLIRRNRQVHPVLVMQLQAINYRHSMR